MLYLNKQMEISYLSLLPVDDDGQLLFAFVKYPCCNQFKTLFAFKFNFFI